MKITIAAATRFELTEERLQSQRHTVRFLYTGVGILPSAVCLTQYVVQQKPNFIIQAGIAGAFNIDLPLGKVVAVATESVGDAGVWENGEWKDLFDMKLIEENEKPFAKRSLVNEQIDVVNVLQLPSVTSSTVNEITTDEQKSNLLKMKYSADIESMEGASLHYVCRLFGVPFIQVRGVSNYVGERDKSKWRMKEAITNVNEAVSRMLALW